jgi:uncharacterized protein (TIGR03437 family)
MFPSRALFRIKSMRIGGVTMLWKRGFRGLIAMLDGFRDRGIRTMIGAAALVACGLWPLQAGATLVLSPDGITVYDTVNNINWLADANLPATNRFGLPVCTGSGTQPCVNASGSMSYQAAAAWVTAMNAANYLGHTNWQLPTTPSSDKTCPFTGPHGESFGFNCSESALGSLYYNALGLKAPNTAVPIPNNTAGPFSNFQPYLYWSQTIGGGAADACKSSPRGCGNATFSFNTGFQGANTAPNYLYVLPMIQGKIAGAPPATGLGLQVNPDKQTVYDPVTNVTWSANANLAATNTFGLAPCKDQANPKPCVNQDGAMNLDSANQFVTNMNTYNGAGYLGQTHWELPTVDPSCPNYNCGGDKNPMGELFYDQLGLSRGMPVVATPNIAVGPFNNIQPYLYWACEAPTIQDGCQTDGPASGFEWSFSFGNGFQGTDILANDLYVTAYFVGPPTSASGPVIAEVANAEGESPTIAPNTWVEIKGVNLAPSGDSRVWANSDFANNKMPTQLDGVSATVNGKGSYVYYISPTQINILTPPDAMSGPVQVVVTNNGAASAGFTAQAQALSPSFFVFNGGPYPAATHVNGTLLGPASLYPGSTTPAKPGETIVLYANGFGPTSTPVISGSILQSGTLSPQPVIKIGGTTATVQFAGLVLPGEFQFNVVVPPGTPDGDQPVTATYNGLTTQAGTLITIQH